MPRRRGCGTKSGMPTTEKPTLTCAQCGRTPSDPEEVLRWRPSELVAAGAPDETTAAALLCPDCAGRDPFAEELGDVD